MGGRGPNGRILGVSFDRRSLLYIYVLCSLFLSFCFVLSSQPLSNEFSLSSISAAMSDQNDVRAHKNFISKTDKAEERVGRKLISL